jgi:microsomal epoxide hydrolase
MSLPKNATIAAKPFKISIPDLQLDDLWTLIRLSKLPPATYEGTKEEYGVTSKWMSEMKTYWENDFNWFAAPRNSDIWAS